MTQTAISCSKRVLDLCTIWLTANGAAGRSGCFALYLRKRGIQFTKAVVLLGVLGIVRGQRFRDLRKPVVELCDV